ncbi:MAG: hypothetical protein L0956_06920 [Candidatus Mariimomonas ferrooxydans]
MINIGKVEFRGKLNNQYFRRKKAIGEYYRKVTTNSYSNVILRSQCPDDVNTISLPGLYSFCIVDRW